MLLLYVNDLAQAVASNLLHYTDDTCVVFQQKSVIEIEKQLISDFSSLHDSVFDNKLSTHFGQNKTKSMLFGTKHKLWNAKSLNIVCNGINIKQHAKVKYLGCILVESPLVNQSMALDVINKVYSSLKVLYR